MGSKLWGKAEVGPRNECSWPITVVGEQTPWYIWELQLEGVVVRRALPWLSWQRVIHHSIKRCSDPWHCGIDRTWSLQCNWYSKFRQTIRLLNYLTPTLGPCWRRSQGVSWVKGQEVASVVGGRNISWLTRNVGRAGVAPREGRAEVGYSRGSVLSYLAF